jgi:cell division protein FtsN
VPEPTQPLGDRPKPAAIDSAGAPPPPQSSLPAPAKPDTCWRIQAAAVPEAKRAESLRAAAESQLLNPWVVDKEDKLYKVRNKDCLDSAEADALRKRAVGAGFTGAFRFRGPKP